MKKKILASGLLALSLAAALAPAAAARRQDGTGRASGQPQKLTDVLQQERDRRARDEEAVRQLKDPGYDFAVVTRNDATIRAQADFSGAPLRQLKREELLALVERNPTGVWYSVIHIDSATEGWIHKDEVVVRFSTNKRETAAISAEMADAGEDPSIVITNNDDTDLNLHIADDHYSVPAHTKRMVVLKPGRYKFHAYRPKVKPVFGEHDFETGYNYTWTFWTDKRVVR